MDGVLLRSLLDFVVTQYVLDVHGDILRCLRVRTLMFVFEPDDVS